MAYASDREVTGWSGWAMFAGVIMVMVGIFQSTAGLVALFNDDFYAVTDGDLVVKLDYTQWGWIHLILGSFLATAGVAVFSGRVWGRAVGVVLAGLSALAHLLFLPATPVWSVIVIAIDVLVIYALCVHGGELSDA